MTGFDLTDGLVDEACGGCGKHFVPLVVGVARLVHAVVEQAVEERHHAAGLRHAGARLGHVIEDLRALQGHRPERVELRILEPGEEATGTAYGGAANHHGADFRERAFEVASMLLAFGEDELLIWVL